MCRTRMLSVLVVLIYSYAISASLYNVRVSNVNIKYNSLYIAGYQLHSIGTFASASLFNCIYLCQNNDYCRTANYFNSNTGSMCSLFEEYSFIGRFVSVSSTTSIVISFDPCPPGFTEPAYICFGLPADTQSPVSVQQALNSLRLVKQLSAVTYNIIIAPPSLYFPLDGQRIVQKFDWPSLRFIANLTVPLPIWDYDMDQLGNFLQTSSANQTLLFSGPSANWSANINYYSSCLSHMYAVALPASGPIAFIFNSTTGQQLFTYTMPSSDNWWSRIINHQLYVTSGSGIRRVNLTQGASASVILLVPNVACKEIFLDASGRLYVEQYAGSTHNNSFVFDLNGMLLANYSHGSKLIVKTSKYAYYVMNNYENPVQLSVYP